MGICKDDSVIVNPLKIVVILCEFNVFNPFHSGASRDSAKIINDQMEINIR